MCVSVEFLSSSSFYEISQISVVVVVVVVMKKINFTFVKGYFHFRRRGRQTVTRKRRRVVDVIKPAGGHCRCSRTGRTEPDSVLLTNTE